MSVEFENKVCENLEKLNEFQQMATEKLEKLDEFQQMATEKLEKLDEFQQMATEKLEKLDEFQQIATEKLEKLDEFQQMATEKFEKIDERFDEITHVLSVIRQSQVLLEEQIMIKIPALFDGYSMHQQKQEFLEENLNSINCKVEDHDIRISILEQQSV